MLRKTAFLFLAMFCFLSTIATHDALSASGAKKETPQVLMYSLEKDGNYMFVSVVRYTNDQFNLLVDDGGCTYRNICKQNGDKFVCDGIGQVEVVSGMITPKMLEIAKADDSKICTGNMPIKGKYDVLYEHKAKDNAILKANVMPIGYSPSDDVDEYALKDKKGKDFYLQNHKAVFTLDKFKNKWIDIEYFQYSFYFEPAADYSTRNVLFRINGKNPLVAK